MLCVKFKSTTYKVFFFGKSGPLHIYETGTLSQGILYTIRGRIYKNAMESNQHSQQVRSTCSAKYAKNVGQYSSLKSNRLKPKRSLFHISPLTLHSMTFKII